MFVIFNHMLFYQHELYLQITRYQMAQSSWKCDTKSKSHPGMKIAPVPVFSCKHPLRNLFYKITKIVRELWLAERSVAWEYVNMVVASRCFAFRMLITQAWIWKSFQVQNSTSLLYLPIPSSAETWKINRYKESVPFFFFLLKLTF